MRFIRLNDNKKIVSIRQGKNIVEGEILSETGQLGQIMQENGIFIDDPNDEINKLNLIKEERKKELIEKMIVANALRDDELWLDLKNEYDSLD